jgi:hypothetical protein
MAKARNTDPATSHQAAKSVRNVTETQAFILRIIEERPRTDGDLIDAYRSMKGAPVASESGIRSRRAELVSKGMIGDTNIRKVLPSGRMSIVWGVSHGDAR